MQQALALLRHKGLAVRISGAGHRVEKYGALAGRKAELGRRESALLCVLMLRGPQTVGELRGRTERMHDFADIADVEHCLESLAAANAGAAGRADAAGALVPSAGRRARSAHDVAEPLSGRAGARISKQRVAALEREVAELKQTVRKFPAPVRVRSKLMPTAYKTRPSKSNASMNATRSAS